MAKKIRVSFSSVVIILALLATACGDGKKSFNSITGPSDVLAGSSNSLDLTDNGVLLVQRFGDKLTVNVYGNIQRGLAKTTDPNGANIRLRWYDESSKRATTIVGYANSSPIGNSNNTIFRDLPVQKVDVALYLEPYGCVNPSCWVPFNFGDRARWRFLPESLRVEVVDGETRVRGDIPPQS